jgi:RNA polymerase sigma-70 factor (ECF subfamily)
MGLVGSVTSPSEAFARNELKERIKFAIDQLKPEDREILGMRHFDDLSFGEAATVLGIAEDAAAKRYARALRRLKRLWSRIGPDGESGPRGGP